MFLYGVLLCGITWHAHSLRTSGVHVETKEQKRTNTTCKVTNEKQDNVIIQFVAFGMNFNNIKINLVRKYLPQRAHEAAQFCWMSSMSSSEYPLAINNHEKTNKCF